jgi:plastocyanin
MAGRLNLAITGIQDQWLTGEPEFSYFLMNFKRHTKFSIESIETPFDGDVDYDASVECRIPKNKGDLIRSTMLKFTLPKPTTPDQSFNVTFQSTGSGNKYFIDGVQQATLTLYEGTTYTFNNASHPSHPFRFSTTAPNTSDYTDDSVTGQGTATVTITPTSATPSILYYYCASHPNMGGQINVKTIRYRESIGAQLIDHADLIIGGQTIERITGDYIYMYDQIHSNKDDIDQTLYFLTGHGNYIDVTYDWDYSVFLPFYFFRNPSLAIPVCALTKQLVEIRIKFKKVEDVTLSYTRTGGGVSDPPSSVLSSIKKVSLVTDFFFITEDEKNFLLTRPIEYVITQLQMSQFKFKAGESKKSGMLNFKNPVKEMFFMAVSDDVYKYEPIKQVTMKFNNNIIIDADNLMLSYEQPLKYYTGVTDNNFGVYSFSLKPETYYPTGQVNMSRIAHNLIDIELDSPDASFGHKVYVYAVNYNVLRISSGLGGLKF